MYGTCLFCAHSLGSNDVLEAFPVGRRLAFDAAKGRLWVVCVVCRRWNLTPLEERWEAIEDAERRFRETRLRVSTGEIGLARLREGLELARVGAPQRPEIAAWRYGEQFSARRRRQLIGATAIVGAGGVAVVGGLALGGSLFATMKLGQLVWKYAQHGSPNAVVARVRGEAGAVVMLRRRDLLTSTLGMDDEGGLALHLEHAHGRLTVQGARARQVARQIFPAINRRGGTHEQVEQAVARLEHAGDAERYVRDVARLGEKMTGISPNVAREHARRGDAGDSPLAQSARLLWLMFGQVISPGDTRDVDGSGLLRLSPSTGLAIEMALHEEQERLVLEGELAELEEAWREAEEIGAIADAMFLPESVEQAWRRLKGSAR